MKKRIKVVQPGTGIVFEVSEGSPQASWPLAEERKQSADESKPKQSARRRKSTSTDD